MAYGPVNGPGMKGDTGAQGATGANGKSAYQIARENGFVGTEAAWLESLKGAKGDKGETGLRGPAGTTPDMSSFYVTAGKRDGTNVGNQSTAEGFNNTATGGRSHAEGYNSTASGSSSHAEGNSTIASGNNAHSEGLGSHATGNYSHAEGASTVANMDYSHAGGQWNKTMSSEDLFVLGYGANGVNRKNVFRITTAGAVYGLSAFNSTGADYAEFFEWQDGNPNGEDRVGRFVTLDGEKVRFATPEDDFILGIVSANASVIGDAFEDQWCGQYVTDIFGRVIMEELTFPEELDEDGNVLMPERTETHAKLSPDYDNTQEYIRRSDRKEWGVIGLMGKLVMVDDGTCQVNGWCAPGVDGAATVSETKTKFRVMARLDETHIRVLALPQ